MYNNTTDPSPSSLALANNYIQLICPPLFLLIGLPGNLISMTIWVRRIRSAPGSTCIFIAVMCATDTFVLTHGCLRVWIKHLPGKHDFRILLGCASPIFIFTFLSDLSVWIIILLCIERAVCVWLPMQSRQLCRPQNGVLALATVILVLVGVNLHFFFTVRANNNAAYCEETDIMFKQFLNEIWPFIDFAFYSFVPLALILMLNLFILYKLNQTQNRLRGGASRPANSSGGSTGGASGSSSNRSGKILRTVVWMTIAHFACTMPIVIYYVATSGVTFCDENETVCDFIEVICKMLQLTNHLTHFFIYSLTSSLFISDLRELCAGCPCISALLACRAAANQAVLQRRSKVAEEFEFRVNGGGTTNDSQRESDIGEASTRLLESQLTPDNNNVAILSKLTEN